MFSESLEHMSGALMMEGDVVFGVDFHVIHVDFKPFLREHICEDVVHEGLKGGGSVTESKEHDSGFEESHGGDESGLPLIFLSDANVVIPPMNVEFGEQGGFLHVVDEFGDQGERIGVSDGVGVQVVVVLTGM